MAELDLDKLQRAIKVCAKFPRRNCEGCEYTHDDWICLHDELMEDFDKAIEMLKEQEAVKPIPPEDEFGLYRCGKCYHQLFRCVDKYCSRCGRPVKWE